MTDPLGFAFWSFIFRVNNILTLFDCSCPIGYGFCEALSCFTHR